MKIKNCSKCNTEKEISEFHKNKSFKDGLDNSCRQCRRERYLITHPNAIIKNKVTNGFKKCTKCLENKKLKFFTLDTKGRPQSACKKCAKNLYNGKDQRHKRYHERLKFDPIYVTRSRIRCQVYQYLKGTKSDKTFNLLKWEVKDLFDKIGPFKGESLDHKIPITWFKENTPVDIVWNLDNLQWCSLDYNRVKNNFWMDKVDSEYLNNIREYIKEEYKNVISL